MENPYEPSTVLKSGSKSGKLAHFFVGARNGFLWSLILAMPSSRAFYFESLLPFARDKVTVTGPIRIAAALDSIAAAALYIVLPWSIVAGGVKMARSRVDKSSAKNE